MTRPTDTPVALTIATSDSGAGAGVQADLLTMAARGVYGTTVFCALTAQNPRGVSAIAELETDFITAQLKAVFEFYPIAAIKTGMLFSARNIATVAAFLDEHPAIPLVVDPVMVATSGAVLLQEDAVSTLTDRLFPRAQLLTPNLDEAGVLLGWTPDSEAAMIRAARELAERFGTAVLLKGGHLPGSSGLVDLLWHPGETEALTFRHMRIPGINTHGSGCTLASAIAAELAKGHLLGVAVRNALHYLDESMRRPVRINGEAFIGH